MCNQKDHNRCTNQDISQGGRITYLQCRLLVPLVHVFLLLCCQMPGGVAAWIELLSRHFTRGTAVHNVLHKAKADTCSDNACYMLMTYLG
jgi:hypothetical protein